MKTNSILRGRRAACRATLPSAFQRRLFAFLLVMLVSGPFAEAAVRTWTGAVSSDWLNSTNWSPNGVPAAGDTVNISSGSISFSSPVTFAGQINWTGGTLGTGQLTLTSEAVLTVSGAADKQFGFATLENFGRVVWADAGRLVWTGSGTLLNAPGATWEIVGDGALDSAYGAGGSITNRGTVLKHASLGTNHLSGAFYNQGRVEVTSGAIRLASGVTLAPSSVLSFGISGASASQQGLMMVNGLLQLQGTVEAHLVNGYVPESDQTYLIVQAGTLAGAFANTNIAIPDSAWTFTPEYLVDSVILRAAARTSTPATLSGAWASGSFHLQIAGGVGETYRLDASTNLTDWTTLLVTNLVTPVLEFNDLAATNYPSRFYRSIAVP